MGLSALLGGARTYLTALASGWLFPFPVGAMGDLASRWAHVLRLLPPSQAGWEGWDVPKGPPFCTPNAQRGANLTPQPWVPWIPAPMARAGRTQHSHCLGASQRRVLDPQPVTPHRRRLGQGEGTTTWMPLLCYVPRQ